MRCSKSRTSAAKAIAKPSEEPPKPQKPRVSGGGVPGAGETDRQTVWEQDGDLAGGDGVDDS